MKKTSIQDDGEKVTVDFHGMRLEQVESLLRKLLNEAYLRGRDSVKIIHGSSTSSLLFENSTIKYKVHAILDEIAFKMIVSQSIKRENDCLVALKPDYEIDRSLIALNELI